MTRIKIIRDKKLDIIVPLTSLCFLLFSLILVDMKLVQLPQQSKHMICILLFFSMSLHILNFICKSIYRKISYLFYRAVAFLLIILSIDIIVYLFLYQSWGNNYYFIICNLVFFIVCYCYFRKLYTIRVRNLVDIERRGKFSILNKFFDLNIRYSLQNESSIKLINLGLLLPPLIAIVQIIERKFPNIIIIFFSLASLFITFVMYLFLSGMIFDLVFVYMIFLRKIR